MVSIRLAACSCAVLILAGCNTHTGKEPIGKIVPVKGKITMADGKPLPGGRVLLFPIEDNPNAPADASKGRPQTPLAVGPVQEDGSYTVSTEGKAGAPVGKYRVALARGAADRAMWSHVAQQYVSQRNSPLVVEVEENKPDGVYDFKLEARSGRR